MRGSFIVLEGVDGSGTTTQTRLLSERLRERGQSVHVTAEPSKGPIGRLLRRALSGRLEEGESPDPAAASWQTLALLFAADRLDHLVREVEPHLTAGSWVLCDRYDYSTLAYQSVGGGGPSAIGWLRELNRHARRPDIAFVLDVPSEVAEERRRIRNGPMEIFDSNDLQARLGTFYAKLEQHCPEDAIQHIDGTVGLHEVTDAILRIIDTKIHT